MAEGVITKINDIVQNTIFGKYVVKAIVEKSAFIKSGVAVIDEHIAQICREAGVQGRFVNMPFWDRIGGPSEPLSEQQGLTLNKITAGQDVAVILRRGKAWGTSGLAAALAGSDPAKAIADQIANYWVEEHQRIAFLVLDGIFASNEAKNGGDLVLDITKEAGNDAYLTKNSLLFAAQLLGDAKSALSAIAMHSMVETVLNIEGNTGNAFKAAETPGLLPSYNGKSVIMDDKCKYDPLTGVAEIVLFGQGAMAMNHVPVETPFETGRDILKDKNILTTRQAWISHVRGVRWAEGATIADVTPSDAELVDPDSWTRVWEKKHIRICKLRCKISGVA